MDFADVYISDSMIVVNKDENGLPDEDDLQLLLDQLDDDIGALGSLRDLLDPQWYNPEEIAEHLIRKGIWKKEDE